MPPQFKLKEEAEEESGSFTVFPFISLCPTCHEIGLQTLSDLHTLAYLMLYLNTLTYPLVTFLIVSGANPSQYCYSLSPTYPGCTHSEIFSYL